MKKFLTRFDFVSSFEKTDDTLCVDRTGYHSVRDIMMHYIPQNPIEKIKSVHYNFAGGTSDFEDESEFDDFTYDELLDYQDEIRDVIKSRRQKMSSQRDDTDNKRTHTASQEAKNCNEAKVEAKCESESLNNERNTQAKD